jgi:hypothetical protein
VVDDRVDTFYRTGHLTVAWNPFSAAGHSCIG